MFELKIISQFAAAHQLREYQGGCENLHGHNWKVEVRVKGGKLGKDGLLIDFREIKSATEEVLKELDHTFLNELEPFTDQNPSSENIARYIFDSLNRTLKGGNVEVSRVSAWESDTACASYWED
jgi:6-pyruvoyltetrahydropterin/6-carboxytetrahydropterin synthase